MPNIIAVLDEAIEGLCRNAYSRTSRLLADESGPMGASKELNRNTIPALTAIPVASELLGRDDPIAAFQMSPTNHLKINSFRTGITGSTGTVVGLSHISGSRCHDKPPTRTGSAGSLEGCRLFVQQLDPARPPGDVPPQRWLQFIADADNFLSGGFALQSVALGWEVLDLFGCDRDRPFARIDKAGLLLLLNGKRLVMLTEQSAIVQTATGAVQTYRCKSGEIGRVLAWQCQR
jgi:hypothetical protein